MDPPHRLQRESNPQLTDLDVLQIEPCASAPCMRSQSKQKCMHVTIILMLGSLMPGSPTRVRVSVVR